MDDGLRLTEAEWLAATASYPVSDYVRARALGAPDPRKVRLYAAASLRDVWHLMPDDRSRRAVEVLEAFADGHANADELTAARDSAVEVYAGVRTVPAKHVGHALACALGGEHALWASTGSAAQAAARALASVEKKPAVREARHAAADARQTGFLRCLFGNPFRPVELDPACRAPSLVALAQADYDARLLPAADLDPVALRALADALEATGGPTAAVAHLRDPGPHVRGCWVIDAVLGRHTELPRVTEEPPPAPPPPPDPEFAPCRVSRNEDWSFNLTFDDFDGTAAVFGEFGRDGGGYDWAGVVDALIRLHTPTMRKKLSYDPEASLLAVISQDRKAVRRVAELIRTALADPAVLRAAIAAADPRFLD